MFLKLKVSQCWGEDSLGKENQNSCNTPASQLAFAYPFSP